MIWCALLALVSVPLLAIGCLYTNEKAWGGVLAMLSAITLVISIGMIIGEGEIKTPTALDVYRGKTTLEITYRDSVAVDSVVVYKMK